MSRSFFAMGSFVTSIIERPRHFYALNTPTFTTSSTPKIPKSPLCSCGRRVLMPPVSSPVSNAVMLRPPQQWAVIAAWISALAGLAPVAWRVHMLIWGTGWDLAPDYRSEPILMGYVVGLCVIEAIASLVVIPREVVNAV